MIWNALATDGTLTYGQGEPPAVGGNIIGVWDYDGVPIGAPEVDAYTAIRPLGNDAGQATGTLCYHHVMGHAHRMLGDPEAADPIERLYPADDQPFEIIIDHFWYEQAEFSGWGFLAEIAGGAASRDPSVRAMAVYSDPEHTQYLWTGGAFRQGPSRLGQVDSEGNPLTVWFSDTPAGFRTAEKTPWNLAVLWASVQEGTCILDPDAGRITLQFWSHSQSATPAPGADWVDTGATITQLVGAGIYRVSAVVTLAPSQALKLGTAETVFQGYWPTASTPSDYLTIAPHVSAAVGSTVWAWE